MTRSQIPDGYEVIEYFGYNTIQLNDVLFHPYAGMLTIIASLDREYLLGNTEQNIYDIDEAVGNGNYLLLRKK